ncbi:MAG: hypothetical protein PHV30_11985 [Candidatus Margulisbacteria bacterium]|nr:hypothetical protein [Candidatus Margulisiibacteriota bacterium]
MEKNNGLDFKKLVPEGKEYYLWIFLGLFAIMIVQFFLYPQMVRVRIHHQLIGVYQKQLKVFEEKITHSMLIDNKQGIPKKKVTGKPILKDPVLLFNEHFLNNAYNSFILKNISYGDKIYNGDIMELPVFLEFSDASGNLKQFFNKLNQFFYPVEISTLEISDLSPRQNFVKIQLLIKKRR